LCSSHLRSSAPGSTSRPSTRMVGEPRERACSAACWSLISSTWISALLPSSAQTRSASAIAPARLGQPGKTSTSTSGRWKAAGCEPGLEAGSSGLAGCGSRWPRGRRCCLPVGGVGWEHRCHSGQRQHPPHQRSGPDQPHRTAVLLDAPLRIDQHPDPGAIQEADPLQVEDQLGAAAVNQVDHNGLEERAGGQVNLPADVDRGTVAVVPDGESKLHHRDRLPVMKRCVGSPSWWDLGSGGDNSGTATETPPCPCGPARRSPGILLAAWGLLCVLLVPPSAAVSADRV